jgi:hypothetical protein
MHSEHPERGCRHTLCQGSGLLYSLQAQLSAKIKSLSICVTEYH